MYKARNKCARRCRSGEYFYSAAFACGVGAAFAQPPNDSEEVIARRLSEAEQEIRYAFAFDYIVVNNDLVQAESDLLHIFKAQRLLLRNQTLNVEKILQNL